MNSLTATTSTPSNLQDPNLSLPNEIFLNLFTFLPSKLILDSSTVNQGWREVILSSPNLFENIHLEDMYFEYEEMGELDEQAAANKIIKQVLRYASLCNNRMKSANLILCSFYRDFVIAYNHWDSTKLSLVFSILTLSSSTLKNLHLEFLMTRDEMISDLVLHVSTVIKKLGSLRALQKVTIRSELGIELISGSSRNSKMLEIQHERGEDERDLTDEIDSTYGSTFAILFQEVTKFTGVGISNLISHFVASLSAGALTELKQSKETLLSVTLRLQGDAQAAQSSFRLIGFCPNLQQLVVEILGAVNPEVLELAAPEGESKRSNLKELRISKDGEARLRFDENFCKWAGGNQTLETLSIKTGCPFSSFDPAIQITFQQLRLLLSSSSSSLQELTLKSVELASMAPTNIQLHQLTRFNIYGNSHLVNFLADIEFTSLREFRLALWCVSGYKKVDHRKIFCLLESCQSSLEKLEIILYNNDPQVHALKPLDRENRDYYFDNRQRSFSLSKVYYMKLAVKDESIRDHYLSIDYPTLSEIHLPCSSYYEFFSKTLKMSDGSRAQRRILMREKNEDDLLFDD